MLLIGTNLQGGMGGYGQDMGYNAQGMGMGGSYNGGFGQDMSSMGGPGGPAGARRGGGDRYRPY